MFARAFSLLSILVGLSAASVLLGAPQEQIAPRQEWNAQWIAHPTAPLREPMVFHFRKAISLVAEPTHYVVHVSADNRFLLYVNGKRVAEGPARGDLQHWRYETADLARYLHAGRNVLAATVWNFGIYSAMSQISDRTAFLMEGDTAAEAGVNTNDSWMVEVEAGQRCLPRPMNDYKEYFVAGPGEEIDGAKYDWMWMTGENGPNSSWVSAGPAVRESVLFDGSHPMAHDHRNDTPWLLEPDQLPPMQYRPVANGEVVRSELSEAKRFPSTPVTIPAHRTIGILIARDAVTTAYPRLVVDGGKGAKIRLTYAGALVDAKLEKGDRAEIGDRRAIGQEDWFYPDGGKERSFEPLWWRGYRFLDLKIETGDEPLTLQSLSTYFTAYPFERKASFQSDDEELNRIWETSWYTATLNAHETYVDSAAVEQLQYVADMRPQVLVSYALTGDDRLARQAIVAIDNSRIPEGLTLSRYPSNIFQVIDGYPLLWIGMVHDYWLWRPDRRFVEDRLLGTRNVLYWFNRNQGEDGMLGRLPFGVWQDWIAKDDRTYPPEDALGRSALITLQYVWALRQAAEMEDAFGYKYLADEYRQRAQKAADATYRLCWDEQAGLVADTPDKNKFSQQVNAFAVMTDVIPKKDRIAVIHRMLADHLQDTSRPSIAIAKASYYYHFYTARAMEHAGIGEEYFSVLKPWREMLHHGFTTFPETPEPTREEAQGWGAHPDYDLLTTIAGIHPVGAGFRTVRIEPALGPLIRLDASMPSPQGMILVSYKRTGERLEAKVTLPDGMTGSFAWKGEQLVLHSGVQTIALQSKIPSQTVGKDVTKP